MKTRVCLHGPLYGQRLCVVKSGIARIFVKKGFAPVKQMPEEKNIVTLLSIYVLDV